MKNNKRKIISIFYENDDDFIRNWKVIKKKGIVKYIIKFTSISIIIILLFSLIDIIKNIRFLGFEKSETLIVALIFGLILGILLSLLSWKFENDRYIELKKVKK